MDTLIPLATFPERGSKVEYRNVNMMPGGETATAVVACQTWGLRTRYVGKLGDDDAARLHREAFAQAGVEAHLISVSGAASPQSLILVDAGGERTVLCRRDDRLILQAEELDSRMGRAERVRFSSTDTIQAQHWPRPNGRVQRVFPSSPISMRSIPASRT